MLVFFQTYASIHVQAQGWFQGPNSKVQIGCIHVQFNLEIARDFTCKSVIVFDRIDIRCTTPAIIYYWADSMQELLPQPQQRDLILLQHKKILPKGNADAVQSMFQFATHVCLLIQHLRISFTNLIRPSMRNIMQQALTITGSRVAQALSLKTRQDCGYDTLKKNQLETLSSID